MTNEEASQVVVIGSSAGGVSALSRLVATVPADFPAPIVLAQHLQPNRPSHLADILERHSTLPVQMVEDRAPLSPGVVLSTGNMASTSVIIEHPRWSVASGAACSPRNNPALRRIPDTCNDTRRSDASLSAAS